jgi:dTDP-glucose 4,6-dehydratase
MDLVTGGAGFMGSHLARRLIERGNEVRVFDLSKSENVPDKAEFFSGDMRDLERVRESMEGVEVVYHLAFVQVFSRRPESEKFQVNFGGTENFLKAAVESGVSRFVHTSTIEVYSPFPPFRAPEDAPTDMPFGWYGRHKRACEELCWHYHYRHDLPLTMLRIPTICGRGYYARIDLLRAFDWILANRPVLWIGGKQYRGDFVWVEDCVQGYILCGTRNEAVGEVFNISCSQPSTSLEIIQALLDAADNTTRIRLVPPRLAWPVINLATKIGVVDMPMEQLQYLMGDYSFSIDKAESLLGYAPEMNAAEAVAELMKGYMEDRESLKLKARTY